MNRAMTVLAAATALLVTGAAVAANYDIGPAVGAKAPALQVADAAGKAQTVKSLSGRKGVVLMFFRSAKWCP